MALNYPIVLAHVATLKNNKKFVTPQFIIEKNDFSVKLHDRLCPHRRYPLADPGLQIENLTCNFHGLSWDNHCRAVNHSYHLSYNSGDINPSGLITLNFSEPNHKWVEDLANEKNLVYSHSCHGQSSGSWLWMMEIQADLLHIRDAPNAIHPELSKVTNLDQIQMYEGAGWILQTCSTGWWLFVYPFTFVEWSPGCLAINHTVPDSMNKEFGFTWMTQFYYNSTTTAEKRKEFESLEKVFREDVAAIERQQGPYYPLYSAMNKFEQHCVHFGNWVKENIKI